MKRRLAPLILLCLIAGLPDADAGPARQDRRARTPVKAGARRQAMRRPAPRPQRPAATTPEGRLRDDLEAIWAGRTLRRGVTAVYVVDARTGKDIYAVHPDDKLNPASNVKLLSTATVLDLVGPRWRYLTRLFGPAPDAAGVARGDVYLRGNSDPTLTRASLEDLARIVARAGVKKIEGNVLLSDDALRETVAPPRIGIRVQAAARIGAAPTVTVDPADSFVQVHVTATTTASRRARLVITAEALPVSPPAPGQAAPAGSWDGPRVLVRVGGTIRKGRSGRYVRSLGMRSTFTGYALRQFLRAAGVEVTGGVRLADFDGYTREALAAGYLPIELARHRSQSMQELVSRVNKRSLNWLADRLLMTAGSEMSRGGPPSMETGLEAMYAWLERTGLDRRHIVIDTGSGLSHRTQITARHLVRVLRTAAGYTGEITRQGLLDPGTFLASLAVGGVDGTLRGRFRGESLRGRVVGKTGTLRDSIALSGFLSDESGPALCFSIVTNGNQWGARYRIRREHELMVAAMKRYLDARSPAASPTRVVVEPETPRPAVVERAASAPAGEPEDDDEGSGEETGDDESSDAAEASTAPTAGRPAVTPAAAPPTGAAPVPAATPAPGPRPEREPRRPDAVAPAP
jgi:D-alanyl-D-alanine carboxypeptidase/D-alanyl-D-alanine-endopeptidase (penicillin-binding protein 4)